MVFWRPKRKQRLNHIKLVFQNILAGQELITISLVIYKDDEDALSQQRAISGLLKNSRFLMNKLCDQNTILSEHNSSEQLRVNKAYREIYKNAKMTLQFMHLPDFSQSFSPLNGWDAFARDFEADQLGTIKANDPFWVDPE